MPDLAITNHSGLYQQLLEERAGLVGDIIEFGAFNGGSAKQLAQFGREVWTLDTFEGMPTPEFDPILDHDEPGKFKPTISLEEMFDGFPNIHPIKGRFIDTIPSLPSHLKFVLAYLDCDLYVSYCQALEYLLGGNHMVEGGIIISDDYSYCRGAKKAVDEFATRFSLRLEGEYPVKIYLNA